MTMYHGLKFYAVKSRDVGTFGGRAKQATIKIYRSNNAGVPACVLDRPGHMAEFVGLVESCCGNHDALDTIMAEFVKFGG